MWNWISVNHRSDPKHRGEGDFNSLSLLLSMSHCWFMAALVLHSSVDYDFMVREPLTAMYIPRSVIRERRSDAANFVIRNVVSKHILRRRTPSSDRSSFGHRHFFMFLATSIVFQI
jgi:hypothetical protein